MLRFCSAWLLMAATAGAGYVADAIGAPFVWRAILADEKTPVPGGSGTFVYLRGNSCCFLETAPAVSAGNVAFWGAGSAVATAGDRPALQGVYAFRYGVPGKVADTSTPIPKGLGNLLVFSGTPAISGGNVVFSAVGHGLSTDFLSGIYAAVPPPVWPANPIQVAYAHPFPGGSGGFAKPAISGGNVAYVATDDVGNTEGIYSSNVSSATGIPVAIATTSSPIPNGTGNFNSIYDAAVGGATFAFLGYGDGAQAGIYVSKEGGPIKALVDTHTTVPGDSTQFRFFNTPFSFDGANVGFVGIDDFQRGVYTVAVPPDLIAIPAPVKVADETTLVPGSSVTFWDFGGVAVDNGRVVFEGTSIQGGIKVRGLYTNATGKLTKLVDTTDTIAGKQVRSDAGFGFGPHGFSGTEAVFAATFTDFSTGIVSVRLMDNIRPRPMNYFRQNSDVWSNATLILGNQRYSQAEAMALLYRPVRGDVSLLLAGQLIAAKLNVLNLACSLRVDAPLAGADGLLARFAGKLPYHVSAQDSAGAAMLRHAAVLGAYNAGLLPSKECFENARQPNQ